MKPSNHQVDPCAKIPSLRKLYNQPTSWTNTQVDPPKVTRHTISRACMERAEKEVNERYERCNLEGQAMEEYKCDNDDVDCVNQILEIDNQVKINQNRNGSKAHCSNHVVDKSPMFSHETVTPINININIGSSPRRQQKTVSYVKDTGVDEDEDELVDPGKENDSGIKIGMDSIGGAEYGAPIATNDDGDDESKKIETILDDKITCILRSEPENEITVDEIETQTELKCVESQSSSTKKMRKFLVKWKDVSYLHCEWILESVLLKRFDNGKRKIRKYKKKSSEIKKKNKMLWSGYPFNPDYSQVERIIDSVYFYNIQEKKQNVKYLVKWKSLPYSQCTFESDQVINKIDPEKKKTKEYNTNNTPPRDNSIKNFDALESQRRAEYGWYDINTSNVSRRYKNNHQLRDYQIEGVNFLIKQRFNGNNCILADEMGLGKTIQTICFLEHLNRIHNISGPYLIIVPLSTINHWQREIKEWTDLSCIVYCGCRRSRSVIRNYEFFYSSCDNDNNNENNDSDEENRDKSGIGIDIDSGGGIKTRQTKFNILLATYETIVTDIEWLAGIKWEYLIVDEGHRLIKNGKSKLSKTIKLLETNHRLIITGTPIQNSINELFNLLIFLQPDKFSHETLIKRFQTVENDNENEDKDDSKKLAELHNIISPFILRRTKEQVISKPKKKSKKTETIINVELTQSQKHYYRALYNRNRDSLMGQDESIIINLKQKSRLPKLMNLQIQLRKICNHPWLIEGIMEKEGINVDEMDKDEYYKKMIESSGKMIELNKLLSKLKKERHKVIIFSQMRNMLDILEAMMKYNGYTFVRFDGTTPFEDRQIAINRFCDEESNIFVFLLTTRVGGQMGNLNLVVADTVIIFDSDWNPQNDIEAQSRCHHIGQSKQVSIYRLVTRSSYESSMFERASDKLGLVGAISKDSKLNDDNKRVNVKDFDQMLRHGAYSLLNDSNNEKEKEKEKAKEEDVKVKQQWTELDIDTILQNRSNKKKKWWKKFCKYMKKICKLRNNGMDINDFEFENCLQLISNTMNCSDYWNEQENTCIENWYKILRQVSDNGTTRRTRVAQVQCQII